jgi:hypothetical protein
MDDFAKGKIAHRNEEPVGEQNTIRGSLVQPFDVVSSARPPRVH